MKTKLPPSFILFGLILSFGVLFFGGKKQVNAPLPPEMFWGEARKEFVEPPVNNVFTEQAVGAIGGGTESAVEVLPMQTDAAVSKNVPWDCAAGNFDCYEDYYASIVKNIGAKEAFDDLRTRYLLDPYTRSQCHPLTHVIGRAASAKFAAPGDAYTEGDPFCWSGYYHGVLEGVIGRIGRSNLPGQMDGICANIKGKAGYSFDYYNCVHGLGHGVMAITQDELFQSLDICDKLTGNWEQVSCASGAFMENIIIDGKNHFTKYLKPDNPLYPCSATPEKYRSTCYLMQTSYMLKINGRDFAKTFEWCKGVEGAHRMTCYQSLGRDASGGSTSNVAQTHDICLFGTDNEQRTGCVVGAVKDFISYFHSDTQAKELCNSFEDEDLRKTCHDTAASYYTQF